MEPLFSLALTITAMPTVPGRATVDNFGLTATIRARCNFEAALLNQGHADEY